MDFRLRMAALRLLQSGSKNLAISIPKPTRKESVSAKRVGDALNLDFENAFVDMVTVTV